MLISDPPSVNSLPGMGNDVRTVDKLYDGVMATNDDRHMWLAPFNNWTLYDTDVRPNQVNFTFDSQICLSAMQFWNYGKTANRGAKEIEVLLDDAVIYKGYLRISNASTILFSGERSELREMVYCDPGKLQDVGLYNEGSMYGGSE